MERVGIHVMSGGRATVPALERLVGEIAPKLGFNWVIVEVNGHFAYQSHPEAAEENPMQAEQVRGLVTLARDHGIQLVPMYNCLGHQSWKERAGALLRSHPEFNEAPEMDATAKDFYCMSWCPNHEGVIPLVCDLFDELLDAFDARAFHVGMDEVFVLGQCARCQGTPNAVLFAKAVNDLHEHLAGRRGVEMMMWGDRFLEAGTIGCRHVWEGSGNDTWPAVDLVPRDIVIADWHYEPWSYFPSVAFFQEKGFRVWPASWNKEATIRRLIAVARRDNRGKVLGYLATTWSGTTEVVAGLAGEPLDPERPRIAEIVAGVKLGAELARG
ncbi:MAG: family 20 glycosylhydrolase [Candidatus Latescibacterota bacterium]